VIYHEYDKKIIIRIFYLSWYRIYPFRCFIINTEPRDEAKVRPTEPNCVEVAAAQTWITGEFIYFLSARKRQARPFNISCNCEC